VQGNKPLATRKTFVIATVQRSGSYLMTEGLANTKLAGDTREWFNPSDVKRVCRKNGLSHPDTDYAAYIKKIQEIGTTANGVFGFKCLAMQWTLLQHRLANHHRYHDMPFHKAVSDLFPDMHYIRLVRRDKIRQAISFYRAAKSKKWHMVGNQDKPAPLPPYSEERIIHYMEMIKKYEDVWERYFDQSGYQPMTVYYEDFIADYEGTLRAVLKFMGIEVMAGTPFPPPRLKKQADVMTDEWVKLFRGYV
jgi:trehalose 2-sulfotransferase